MCQEKSDQVIRLKVINGITWGNILGAFEIIIAGLFERLRRSIWFRDYVRLRFWAGSGVVKIRVGIRRSIIWV